MDSYLWYTHTIHREAQTRVHDRPPWRLPTGACSNHSSITRPSAVACGWSSASSCSLPAHAYRHTHWSPSSKHKQPCSHWRPLPVRNAPLAGLTQQHPCLPPEAKMIR